MKYANIEWRDGQPYSPEYDDIYFSSEGGREESAYVFLQQNALPQRWLGEQGFVVAETGFGTGLNFVLTSKAWMETADETACLHYIAIEKHPVAPDDIRRLAQFWPDLKPYFDAMLSVYVLPLEGHHTRALFDGRVYLHFVFMDVLDALADGCFQVDAWYLDGFGPAKNPDLWRHEVFRRIAQHSKKGARLSTFSCAGDVRRGLSAAGFVVSKVPGFGRKREMISAVLDQTRTRQSSTPWYELPQNLVTDKTAIVIGAGIAGLSCAWSLVQRGWKVTVLDKDIAVAQGASGNPAALLMPRLAVDNDTDVAFYSSAFLYAVTQLNRLQPFQQQPFWFDHGVLSIYESSSAEKIMQRYAYPESFIYRPAAAELPECLAHKAGRLAMFPQAGWLLPVRVCEALLHACGDALSLRAMNVSKLERCADGWKLLSDDTTMTAQAGVVVIANGVGVNAFEQTSWLPVSSIRGQLTLLPASGKSSMLEQALSFDAYLTPAHDGVHVLGATYSYINTSNELSQQDQDTNLDRLEKELPGMFERPQGLSGRVGFRSVSADRVPVAGAVPDIDAFQQLYSELHHGRTNVKYENGVYLPGLYVSAAHGSRGFCSSFLSAELLAAMITNSTLPVTKAVSDYLNPARFVIRHLRRSPKKTCQK